MSETVTLDKEKLQELIKDVSHAIAMGLDEVDLLDMGINEDTHNIWHWFAKANQSAIELQNLVGVWEFASRSYEGVRAEDYE